MNHAERTQGHASGLGGRRKGRVDAVEIRERDASAFTGAAVVASGTSFVSLGEDSGAADGEHALAVEMLAEFAAHKLLRAIQFHRRKEVAVGQLRKAQRLA